MFAAGRDAEIPDSLTRLRAHDALLRPGLLLAVERAVLDKLGLTSRGDDADTGAHDGTRERTD